MPEITINLSWFPAWMLWTVGGALYFTIGLGISCLFKVREAKQHLYSTRGCGAQCCPGNICGKPGYDSHGNSFHTCRGVGLTLHHQNSYELCQVAKCLSIPAWPAMLAIGLIVKFCCLIKDLWWHAGQYGLSHSQQKGS